MTLPNPLINAVQMKIDDSWYSVSKWINKLDVVWCGSTILSSWKF